MPWDLRDKTALVTGATSGIGLEASVELARLGARVVMVGRDPARTEAAVADVMARSGSREVPHLLCDFSSQATIRKLAADFLASHDRLHFLVNNAGGVNKTRRVMVDGIERTFAVNHLGYFLLTNLLCDLLVRSAPTRFVTVASIGHRSGSLDFDDLGFERGGYSIMRAYSRSKLANVLCAAELVRRCGRNPLSTFCGGRSSSALGKVPPTLGIWRRARSSRASLASTSRKESSCRRRPWRRTKSSRSGSGR